MLRRIVGDESGMTMALVLIIIVLVGVMGVGLLTFVNTDLQAVVEVNEGQKALDLADAGVQVAADHLYFDNIPAHYDVDDLLNPLYVGAGCNVAATNPEESKPRIPASENWSPEGGGVTKGFAGGQFTVTIRYLPSTTNPACRAPASTSSSRAFFKVVSTGTSGGAVRKVEAVYETRDNAAPKAFVARGDLAINGTTDLSNVSLFAYDDVDINGGPTISGPDLAYGNWTTNPDGTANGYNLTGRGSTTAGIGALGNIDTERADVDYDGADGPVRFVSPASSSQPSNEITFPFNPDPTALDADALCEIARSLDGVDGAHYQPVSNSGNYSITNWPASNTTNTVVCVDFVAGSGGARVASWDVAGTGDLPAPYPTKCKAPVRRGVLVVRNGNYSTAQNKAMLSGVVIVRGGVIEDGDYGDEGGNTCMEGFANASGDIKLAGNVEPYSTADLANAPGFYDVTRWSWRECYNTACN